jgi:F-type H+-transporting ATPase subunit delta
MNDSKISVRYSRALFEAALDKKIIDKVNNDMVLISEVCKTPEAKEFLDNPVIPPSKKLAILHKMFEGKVEAVTLSLMGLVVKNGREAFLPGIARVFITETLKYKGITEAVLTSAVPVSPEIRKQITDLVSDTFSTKVDLKEIVNPDIIGGFVLRIGDNFIDASIKKKLRKIRKELLESPIANS